MKYPTRRLPKRRTEKRQAFHGLNTQDHPALMATDQLCAAENVWSPHAILQTRPGLRETHPSLLTPLTTSLHLRYYEIELINSISGGYNKVGVTVECRQSGHAIMAGMMMKPDGTIKSLVSLILPTESILYETVDNITLLEEAPQTGCGLFMAVAVRVYYTGNPTKKVYWFELDDETDAWKAFDCKQFYTPVSLRYGRGNWCYSSLDYEGITPRKAEVLEEYNLLNGGRTMYFTTDGYSDAFTMPADTIGFGGAMTIRFLRIMDTPIDFSIAAGATDSAVKQIGDSSVQAHLDRTTGVVSFTSGDKEFALPRSLAENGLEITAYIYDEEAAYRLLCVDTLCRRYDGRVFLVGGDADGNKIFYSEKDKPFYFHVSAFLSVGEKGNPITALALQNRYFFVFKKNEIYRIIVDEGKAYDLTAPLEDYTDITLPKLTARMTRVHSSIGCDCPHSLAFCSNRLVWYHTDGTVYTLYGSNGYTEGSVYALSPNIESQLKNRQTEDLCCISGCEKDGFYYLSDGNTMYVGDTHISGFRYLSGKGAPSSGNGGLSWYKWTLPDGLKAIRLFRTANQFGGIFIDERNGRRVYCGFFDDTQDKLLDANQVLKEQPIPFTLETALMGDIGQSGQRLFEATVDFRSDDAVTVCLKTEIGYLEPFTVESKKHWQRIIRRPGHIRCRLAGLCLTGQGRFQLGGLTLTFEA